MVFYLFLVQYLYMKKNIGSIDAVVRTDLAFVLAYIYYTNFPVPTVWYTVGLLAAGHLLATAVFGISPMYKLFGISTNKGKGDCKKCDKNGTCAC